MEAQTKDGRYPSRKPEITISEICPTTTQMDVLYGNTGNGQYVVDYEYNGGINQQWQLVPTTIETDYSRRLL